MKKLSYRNTLNCCYAGYITQAVNVNLLPLLFVIFQKDFGISYALLSGLVLANFAFQLLIDCFSAKITDILDFRNTMLVSLLFSFVGLVLLGTLPCIMTNKIVSIIIPTIIFSMGAGLLEVVVSPICDSLPLGEKSSQMSLLHSFYSWGQLLTVVISTLLIKVLGNELWFVVPLLWSALPLGNFIACLFMPFPHALKAHERTNFKQLVLDPQFLLAFGIMVCAGATEMVISQWSSLFAEQGLGISKVMGDLLGPAFFALLMALGRMFFGIFGSKLNLKKWLVACSACCVLCYGLLALFPNRYVSLLACGITGLGVSLLWPGMLAQSSKTFPMAGTLLFGLLAVGGDIGCAIGPSISGFVTQTLSQSSFANNLALNLQISIEELSLRGGMLSCTIFPLILLTLTIVAYCKKQNN